MTGHKIHRLKTNGAFGSPAWVKYLQKHGILHEMTAPYSSAQSGLVECAIRTTIKDVHSLLQDSGLGHFY